VSLGKHLCHSKRPFKKKVYVRKRQKSYYRRDTVVLNDVKQTNRTRKINRHTKKQGYHNETKTGSTIYILNFMETNEEELLIA